MSEHIEICYDDRLVEAFMRLSDTSADVQRNYVDLLVRVELLEQRIKELERGAR